MAYDKALAEQIRRLLRTDEAITEMRAFGGLAFLVNGNIAVSASGQGGLMVRVDPQEAEALVGEPHAQAFEMRGRRMKGWLRIAPEGLRSEAQLERWVARGVSYARTLPGRG